MFPELLKISFGNFIIFNIKKYHHRVIMSKCVCHKAEMKAWQQLRKGDYSERFLSATVVTLVFGGVTLLVSPRIFGFFMHCEA
ncbi:MAG: hypothetical protein IPL22_13950 [Bacteroidetes bacterium]|nr:hypothetical protein [Bacteroidota bacterium]